MERRKRNNVRALREEILMSKAELARRAGVSPLTIDRIESGMSCRLDTKRKIILALGKKLNEKGQVFPELGPVQELDGHVNVSEPQGEGGLDETDRSDRDANSASDREE